MTFYLPKKYNKILILCSIISSIAGVTSAYAQSVNEINTDIGEVNTNIESIKIKNFNFQFNFNFN